MRRAVETVSALLALLRRAKRKGQPRVTIDVDVFSLDGRRAVAIYFNPLTD